MDQNIVTEILRKSPLFKHLTEKELKRIQRDAYTSVNVYDKGSMIFLEGEKPECLYLLLSGNICISKGTLSGKRILIAKLDEPGEIFGEVYLFMEKEGYEVQAEAIENSVLLVLQHHIFKESSRQENAAEEQIRRNLMEIFAMKAYHLTNKVRVLGCSSIREKVAVYLIQKQTKEGIIQNNLNREDMADYINVTRPSLSRELSQMVKENILKVNGKKIEIIDQEALEGYL